MAALRVTCIEPPRFAFICFCSGPLVVEMRGGGSDLQRQPGLADAAGSRQRDKTSVVKQLRHGRHFLVPADEAAEGSRQVTSHVSCVQRKAFASDSAIRRFLVNLESPKSHS
jgi:hypothetical protein